MAVQARHPSHAFFFPHDLHAFRGMEDAAAAGTAFFDEYGWCAPAAGLGGATVPSDFPRGELACNYGFGPRKRPRVAAAAGFLEDHCAVLPPAVAAQELVPVTVGNGQGRAVGSGTASTSGSVANGAGASQSQGLLSRLYHHQGLEIDALVTLEMPEPVQQSEWSLHPREMESCLRLPSVQLPEPAKMVYKQV
ncbi:putative BOI-related E3 ubiquitin-protein ligase 2 [Panicum miliaceum]|uniref:BOI-related E3 ubiquitin-protein ligase 2 n=1 Tax=Panicum miliaceum TaxID=4540 RepID=A0A3L6PY13_PANMI|nr:putative BOI-related E3 ubiquitin-protein ligase 2 [Panicum miliaceum]